MKAAEYRAKHMTEGELQTAVCELLTRCGWEWFHDNDSKRNRPGFPDLVASHPAGLLIAVELKGPMTPVTKDQRRWIEALGAYAARSPHAPCFTGIIRPADWVTGDLRRFITEEPHAPVAAT